MALKVLSWSIHRRLLECQRSFCKQLVATKFWEPDHRAGYDTKIKKTYKEHIQVSYTCSTSTYMFNLLRRTIISRKSISVSMLHMYVALAFISPTYQFFFLNIEYWYPIKFADWKYLTCSNCSAWFYRSSSSLWTVGVVTQFGLLGYQKYTKGVHSEDNFRSLKSTLNIHLLVCLRGVAGLGSSSSRTEDSNICVFVLSSSSWSIYHYVLVIVPVLCQIGPCPHEDIWPGATRTFYEDLDYVWNNWLSMIMLLSMLTGALLVSRLLTVLVRTNCPHEDRLKCPHPHPRGLFQ